MHLKLTTSNVVAFSGRCQRQVNQVKNINEHQIMYITASACNNLDF